MIDSRNKAEYRSRGCWLIYYWDQIVLLIDSKAGMISRRKDERGSKHSNSEK